MKDSLDATPEVRVGAVSFEFASKPTKDRLSIMVSFLVKKKILIGHFCLGCWAPYACAP